MIMQLLKIASPLFGVILIGTFGYTLIEGWPLFDSLYMTVISLTTVGYTEVHTLSASGRVFTITLILLGIGNVAYVIQRFSMEFFHPFFDEIIKEKKMNQKLKNLDQHYIICGFGRIGIDLAHNLIDSEVDLVVIDRAPPRKEDELDRRIPYLIGDANDDDVLIRAGIDRAKGLVASVKSEADNIFITLSARQLNPNLFIISRFEEETTRSKLTKAGADRVINPYQIGSQKITEIILKPTINKILDIACQDGEFKLDFEEMELKAGSPLIGQTLRLCEIREKFNVIIVAVEKKNGQILTTPGANYLFQENDRLVVMGNQVEIISVFKEYGVNA